MIDAFTVNRGDCDSGGRIYKPGVGWQLVRIRSAPSWGKWHWIDGGVLCGGSVCIACDRGFPRRQSAFLYVDRPGGTIAVLQCTETDLAAMCRASSRAADASLIGAHFRLRRPGSRQPLAVEFAGESSGLVEIPQSELLIDVARFYHVRLTSSDFSGGRANDLIQARLHEVVEGRRVRA